METIFEDNVINMVFARKMRTQAQTRDKEVIRERFEEAMAKGDATQEEGKFFIHLLCDQEIL